MAKEPKATRYVTQDGADFYIYRDAGLTDLQTVWTYRKGPVRTLEQAKAARAMCEDQLDLAGYDHEWPNPFGDLA